MNRRGFLAVVVGGVIARFVPKFRWRGFEQIEHRITGFHQPIVYFNEEALKSIKGHASLDHLNMIKPIPEKGRVIKFHTVTEPYFKHETTAWWIEDKDGNNLQTEYLKKLRG